MVNNSHSPSDRIFLLGAGASVDAGMPTVKELTSELRSRLRAIRPEFEQVFELIEKNDPSVAQNYERLFEWIVLILKVNEEPFRKIIETRIESSMIASIAGIYMDVCRVIKDLFEARRSNADYLSRIGDYLPTQGRLKVFSLNYDCCLEDACRVAGIDLSTGFDPITKKWDRDLFHRQKNGINLYKLHGSLRWFGVEDNQSRSHLTLMELRSGDIRNLSHNLKVSQEPRLVLGPGNKIQPDEPFIALFYEFQSSIMMAHECVIIGYGGGDEHVNNAISHALDAGVKIIDINTRGPNGRYSADAHYHYLKQTAQNALLNGNILPWNKN